jgi:ATP-dependent RNA helicase DDX52/ROK1
MTQLFYFFLTIIAKCDLRHPVPISSFEDLKLRYGFTNSTLKAVIDKGWRKPTAIQRQVIPAILENKEIIAVAPTGSGKTLAFLLPIMFKIRESFNAVALKNQPICSILSPTRELAGQLCISATSLNIIFQIKIKLATKAHLASGGEFHTYDVIIGTPLRVMSFINQGKLDLATVKYSVLDEADRLLEDAFLATTDRIVHSCKERYIKTKKDMSIVNYTKTSAHQYLFTATLPPKIEKLLYKKYKLLKIIVGVQNKPVNTIKQRLIFVGKEAGKLFTLYRLIEDGTLEAPILVFVESNDKARILHRELLYSRVSVDSIYSEQPQSLRNTAINLFKTGKTSILISTDLISRGIDIPEIKYVINFDFPNSALDYIHRIGRAGRGGRSGFAFTFYTIHDSAYLKPIVNMIHESEGDIPSWILKKLSYK